MLSLSRKAFANRVEFRSVCNLSLIFSMATGIVKKKVEGKGFGFIAVEGQEKDLFFHAKELMGVTFEELREGESVSFEVTQSEKGPAATNVSRA